MSNSTEGFTDRTEGLPETDDQEKIEIRRQISFGMDMEAFLRSSVGQYLSRRAAKEIHEFRVQLDTIEATDANAIRALQLEIAARKVWRDWIELAINEGIAAQETALERNTL